MAFRWLRIGFFSLISLSCYAQFDKNFKPSPYQDTIPEAIHALFKDRLSQSKSKTHNTNSKVNTFAKELYEKRFEYLVKTFNEDYFITESSLTTYLQQVLQRIYQANPTLVVKAEVYPFRSSVPNALSFGDGTIAFMLGLLERMESEDQVAFVLCHELAHLHAQHSDKRIQRIAELNYDKELKRKIAEINRSGYNRYSRLKEISRDMGISLGSHSRDNEFEADSLALIFFLNTAYNPAEAIRCIEILDSVDVALNPKLLELHQAFNFKAYPFKESWGAYKKSDTWYRPLRDGDDDTLRTHPDCKRRIIALQRQLAGRGKPLNERAQTDFSRIILQAQFDLVDTEFHYKQYGKALFKALQLVEIYPDNVYLSAKIGQCLYQLYDNQKNHTLGKVLDLPDPRFPENYDRFLTFIHKLRLGELAALAYHHIISQREEFFNDEEFLYTAWLVSRLDISRLDPESIKEDYFARYPDGRYRNAMKRTH